MKVYTYPFTITGTATVKAESPAEAITKLAKLCAALPVSVLQYDDPELPEASASHFSANAGEPVLMVEDAAPPLQVKPSAARMG